MLALVASSAFESAFDFEFLRETDATDGDRGARLIANLHDVLVDPNAAPGAAVAAKRMLLSVLERAKGMRPAFMLLPPIAEARARGASKPLVERVNEDPLCATCKRPIAALSRRPSNRFPKKARASSSSSFRARTLPSRGRHAFSPATRTSLTESRGNDLHEHAELL